MRDHQYGCPLAVDFAEQVHNLKRERRVDIAGRLVRDDELRVIDQSAREADALLFAAGKLGRLALRLVLQIDQAQEIRHAAADLLVRRADDMHRERHVLVDGHIVDQAEILKHNAHHAPQIRDLPPFEIRHHGVADDNGSLTRPFLAHNQLQKGAFARSGGADNKHEFAFVYVQIDMIERMRPVGVHFAHILKCNHGCNLISRSSNVFRQAAVAAAPSQTGDSRPQKMRSVPPLACYHNTKGRCAFYSFKE